MYVRGVEVVEQAVLSRLGPLPMGARLGSTEAIAALLRRAAGFLCPCPQRALIDAVVRAAGDFLDEDGRDEVGEVLEALYVAGDLVEVAEAQGARRVYLAAPSFLIRASGNAVLQGIVPDQTSGLPAAFEAHLRVRGVARLLAAAPDLDWEAILPGLGFAPIVRDHWFGAPSPSSAAQHIAAYARRLDSSPEGGDTAGLIVLDPDGDPTYYGARRVDAGSRRGRFVGRRTVRHGSPIWCYVDIADGHIRHLCDFADGVTPTAAAAEAWHLQMALDAAAGRPQRYRVRGSDPALAPGELALDLFSPLPCWAEQRMETIGRRMVAKGRSALMSFALPVEELAEEQQFLERVLWLKPQD